MTIIITINTILYSCHHINTACMCEDLKAECVQCIMEDHACVYETCCMYLAFLHNVIL